MAECICYLKDVKNPPNWVKNPDPLGCPVHGPTKQYCRRHHSGFYGSCDKCQLDQLDHLLPLLPPEAMD